MKKRGRGAFVLAAALTMAYGCQKPSQPAEGVWAVVDGKDITRAEVDKFYRTQLNPDAPEPSQDEALSLKLNILDELINNQILLEKAKKLGLEAADGEVEDKFTEFKSPYTEDEFQRQLKSRGYTVDDLRSDIRQQISIQKVINREVVAKITVTDQDVQDFYNQNRAQFNVSEPQYRLAQIVVTPHKDPRIAQSQERRRDHRRRGPAQGCGARAATEHWRGLRASRHGLLGRPAVFRFGRRSGLCAGIVARRRAIPL